jgi:hypothetical protein
MSTARRTLRYAVTFENWTTPPLTMRGEVISGSVPAAAGRAVRAAMKQARGQYWKSLVVLLEKSASDGDE